MHLFYVTAPADVAVRYYYCRGERFDESPYAFSLARGRPVGEPEDGACDGGDFERLPRLRAPEGDRVPADHLFMAYQPIFFKSLGHFQAGVDPAEGFAVRLVQRPAAAALLAGPGMPVRLDGAGDADAPRVLAAERLAAPPGRRPVRLAVMNHYHMAFGDTLAHLVVLRELRRSVEERLGAGVEIDLLQHRCNREAEVLYRRSGVIRAIRHLPLPLSAMYGYDGYFDVYGTLVSTRGHWVDEMMRSFGVDPRDVPPARKRMRLPPAPAPRPEVLEAVARARETGREVVLFHPRANDVLRSCPDENAAELAREILERRPCVVASAVPVKLAHPRFVDWSPHSRTLDDFAALIAGVDAVVSADTSAYHLADALGIPGVALFTTVLPERRVAYYPHVRGIALQPPENPLADSGTVLTPEEVSAAAEMWRRADVDRVLAELDRAIAGAERLRPLRILSSPPSR
jgi:hypothetical protein